MKRVLAACSNCGHQYSIKLDSDTVTLERIGYVVVEHCEYCMDLNDLTIYSLENQKKILRKSPYLREQQKTGAN